MSIIFVPGTKFVWKRIVNDLLGDDSPTPLQLFFKLFVAFTLILAHIFPLTILLIVKDPIFHIISWTSFGFLLMLLLYFGIIKLVLYVCNPFFKIIDFNNRKITISALILSVFTIWTAYENATKSPNVIRYI